MSEDEEIGNGDAIDLAQRWYVPIEIQTLKVWLATACAVSLLLCTVDWLRGDWVGLQLQLITAGFLGLIVVLLHTSFGQFTRDLVIGISGLGLGVGTIHLAAVGVTPFNLLVFAWVLIPSMAAVAFTSSSEVSSWVSGKVSTEIAESGLARNRRLAPHLTALGSHVVLLHAVALVLIPVIWVLDVAISPGNSLGGQLFDTATTEHFSKVLGGESFWVWLTNSVIVSVGTTILGLSLAIPAGYAFSRWKFTGRQPAMFSFLLVQMFPGIIILVPYFLVMKSLGLLNSWLGLVLAYSVTALPLCVWMLKGFFDTVPRELEEAALLDGCTQPQVFRKIILPLSLPAVAVTALFSFLAAWNEFLLALTFNTSNDMYTLPVGLASMISATGQAWGDFAAASLLVSIPVVLLFIIFQKFLIQGLSAGGVKG